MIELHAGMSVNHHSDLTPALLKTVFFIIFRGGVVYFCPKAKCEHKWFWRKRLSWWWCCLQKKSHFRRQMSPNRPGRLRKRGLIECVEPWIEKQNVQTNFQGFLSVHRSVSDAFDCLTCPPPPPIQSEVKCGYDYFSKVQRLCCRVSHWYVFGSATERTHTWHLWILWHVEMYKFSDSVWVMSLTVINCNIFF